MRILQVVHLFLPRARGGVEVYTHHLSRELARGHDLALFFTEHRPGTPSYTLDRIDHEGIPAWRAVNNKNYRSFEETYRDARMERLFERVLDEFRPDVIHLQHLLYHSLGYVRIARDRGIPVVFTLHEYWLICLRRGQMILPDLALCPLPEARDCARCARERIGMATPLERIGDAMLRTVRRASGVDLWPAVRRARIRSAWAVKKIAGRLVAPPSSGRPGSAPPLPDPDPADVECVERRWRSVREAIREVDLFLAPSPFLREMFVRFGVPEDRIVLSDYGFDPAPFASVVRPPHRGPVRFGFVGNLVPVKGLHVAVEAFLGVDPGRAELVVHGSEGHRPDYVGDLKRRARGHPVRFAGSFDPSRIAEILASLDVLVIPSVWYENSPLTIHEGFLAGLPVLTSDLGGMKDLVTDGVNGFLFRPGDPADLRRRVEEILDRPERFEAMRARRTPVKSIAENAEEIEGIYRKVAAGRRDRRETATPREAR